MKKTTRLLILLIAFAGMLNAQNLDLNGIWKFTESIEYGDQTKIYISYISFKDNHAIEVSGRDMGTWLKNDTENTLTIDGSPFQGVEGENLIETLNDKELKLKNPEGKINILYKIGLAKGKELTNNFTGEWLIGKVEKDGEIDFAGALIELNSNGVFYTAGYIFGEWNYNSKTEKLVFNVKEKKDAINGEHAVLESNTSTFILDVKGAKYHFSKIDHEKIAKENELSGLIGTWKTENKTNAEEKTFLAFKTPDELVYVVKTKYRNQKGGAMWMFNKEEMILTMIGFYDVDLPEGESKVTKLNDASLELEKNGKTYSLKKVVQDAMEIEHLTFSDKDFYDETGDYVYYEDESKLPWQDSSGMIRSLENVKQLEYNYSTLIESVNVFESKTLTANVNSNYPERELSIDYIFDGYDSYNLPDDTELQTRDYDFNNNKLYPEEYSVFRVIGEEEIKTPAGTFNCKVVEAIEDSDYKIKIWMIIDKPGIFAKIIKEKTDDTYGSGYYNLYELQEIK